MPELFRFIGSRVVESCAADAQQDPEDEEADEHGRWRIVYGCLQQNLRVSSINEDM
jgi:hypothetical protein